MTWSIGMSTGCCVDKPIGDVLDAMNGRRIRGVEIGTPPRHFDPWRHAEIAAVRERLDRYGITPISIHAPFGGLLDLTDPNLHHRHAAIGAVLTAAAALRELGGSLVVVHASDVPRNPAEVEHRLANCTAALQVLGRACEQMQMTLTLETPLPHLIGGHPDEFEWILRRLEREIAVCLDTGHTTLGHHWRRFIEVAGERVKHVHASDHHGHRDDHLPPGDGSIDWCEISDGLKRVGFQGWIMLELSCPDGRALQAQFSRAMAQAEGLLA
jgi:sugar phosphate isomerase/epimerase